ncbi:excinuclease UvrABC ATPase subunit [Catenulispora sp. GP43]|uniref:ATP-binding cassette domain-containing protein n=1 Tax=Catenulispora sp. GP43 TaxID=3156263 RepID=UPI0035126233
MQNVTEWIEVRGAREHNLRAVDVAVPKRALTAVTGVSGSGKSSLVFDTIAVEARRQLNETLPAFVRGFLPALSRPAVDAVEHLPAVILVDQRRLRGGARSTVGTITDIAPLLRLLFSRAGEPLVPHADAFSFNMPAGMCPACEGLGEATVVDLDAFLDRSRSLEDGALRCEIFAVGSRNWQILAGSGRLDPRRPVAEYSEAELHDLLHADDGVVAMEFQGQAYHASYEGAVTKFRRLYLDQDPETRSARTRKLVAAFTKTAGCPDCGGTRLSPLALSSRVAGHTIADLSAMPVSDLVKTLEAISDPAIAPLLNALWARLEDLIGIGLGYLSLDRRTASLSGGEAQRVKLVRQLASSLNDLLYVFDEPSIGMHPRDVSRMTDLLRALRDKGNSVLVVEHDRDVIVAADHVIDIGPGAGAAGGEIGYTGDVPGLRASATLTGRFLDEPVRLKSSVRAPTGKLPVVQAGAHNLTGFDLDVPTGVLTVLTGVAGSGKSTLAHDVLRVQHPAVIAVDQSPPGANRRSTVATYAGVQDPIRRAFARANGVDPALFSANSAGACPECAGLGVIEQDLAYLDTVAIPCPACHGRRFTDEVLRYRLRGRSIGDVLETTVAEAVQFFAAERRVSAVLGALATVGLDYLRLGQPLTTLSGGEGQRLKLAGHLAEPGGVYVLDEPTTGLHMSDVRRLLAALDRLIDGHGATVIVIEHNLDLVAHADWVIDLGPEAGNEGGRVLYEGTPADLVRVQGSHTGEYLRRAIEGTPVEDTSVDGASVDDAPVTEAAR